MGRKEEERGREKGGRGEERQQTVKKQLKLVEYSSTIKNIPKHQPGKVSQRTSMGVDLFVSPIFWYRSFSVSACVCVCMNVHTYIGTCITQNGRGREGRREGGRQGGRETGREGDREGGREGDREGGREGDREEGRGAECTYLEALPREAAPQKVHKHVSKCLQVVSSALLWKTIQYISLWSCINMSV